MTALQSMQAAQQQIVAILEKVYECLKIIFHKIYFRETGIMALHLLMFLKFPFLSLNI